jgi:hypothetical protein
MVISNIRFVTCCAVKMIVFTFALYILVGVDVMEQFHGSVLKCCGRALNLVMYTGSNPTHQPPG